MTAQHEDREPVQTDCLDPFPEPHTIPSGGDLSGLFPDPQTDSVIDEDSNADGESQ